MVIKAHFKKLVLVFIALLSLMLIEKVAAQNHPKGTTRVGTDMYIDQTEVDVGSWLSFYSWILSHKGYSAAQQLLPDSGAIAPELWQYIIKRTTEKINKTAMYSGQPIGFFEKKCVIEKKDMPKFQKTDLCPLLYLPITGISYEQANEFCKWRTAVQGNNNYIFRLPTSEEWIKIALSGLVESEKKSRTRDSLNSSGCPNFNFSTIYCQKFSHQGTLNSIGLYSPDIQGLFDIWGNVSEMTFEKGIAKGGHFLLYASQCHSDSVQNYLKPEIWLGFRCVAVRKGNPITEKEIGTINNSEKDSISDIIWSGNSGMFTDNRDGNSYKIIRIKEQVWMAQNLAYRPAEGKYWAYMNNEGYIPLFGYLYNWETAQNACPTGWHLPTKNDFEILLQEYESNENAYKELMITGNSGFSIVNCGLLYGFNFTPETSGTAFWSATEKNKRTVWGLGVGGLKPVINLYHTYPKKAGLPIRCLKDN